jgi:hypothetical protein
VPIEPSGAYCQDITKYPYRLTCFSEQLVYLSEVPFTGRRKEKVGGSVGYTVVPSHTTQLSSSAAVLPREPSSCNPQHTHSATLLWSTYTITPYAARRIDPTLFNDVRSAATAVWLGMMRYDKSVR